MAYRLTMSKGLDSKLQGQEFLKELDSEIEKWKILIEESYELKKSYKANNSQFFNLCCKSIEERNEYLRVIKNLRDNYEKFLEITTNLRIALFNQGLSPEKMRKFDAKIDAQLKMFFNPPLIMKVLESAYNNQKYLL